MRKALQSLPGVEKDSVQVNTDTKLATFKVSDPKQFKVESAIKKIDDVGFEARLTKAGADIPAK